MDNVTISSNDIVIIVAAGSYITDVLISSTTSTLNMSWLMLLHCFDGRSLFRSPLTFIRYISGMTTTSTMIRTNASAMVEEEGRCVMIGHQHNLWQDHRICCGMSRETEAL